MSNSELVYRDLVARGKQEFTARCWRSHVRRFEGCCGVRSSYRRDDVVKFMAMLRGEGMKQNSINTVLRPIKLLCELQLWEGGFPRLSMPRVRRCDISRPRLSVDEVGKIVSKAKEVCSGRELAYLAAATIYGLRREELGSLVFYDGVVRIETVKGGEVAIQLVPAEIKGFVKGYYGCNDMKYLTRVFQRIVELVGVELPGGYGWHSIRRALASELLEVDASLLNILRFMRWSEGSLMREFGMLAIYAERKQSVVDEAILKVHPFVGFWS